MFGFSRSSDSAAFETSLAFRPKTLWRGFLATVICAFGLGCATIAPIAQMQTATPTPRSREISPELPAEAQALCKNADILLNMLREGDVDNLNTFTAHDAEPTHEKVFEVIQKTLVRLGKIKESNIEQIQHKGDIMIGVFHLQFESMSTQLSIVTRNDEILAWEFDGKEIEKQLQYTYFSSFEKLTIVASTLQDAQGQEHDATFNYGEKLHITLMVAGFERRTNFAHVRLRMHLKNDKGELLQSVNVADNSMRIKTNEPPAISLTTWLALTTPGRYTVELEVQDVYSKNSLVHAQNIQITSQSGAGYSKVFMGPQ
jgi:hypothetical protein